MGSQEGLSTLKDMALLTTSSGEATDCRGKMLACFPMAVLQVVSEGLLPPALQLAFQVDRWGRLSPACGSALSPRPFKSTELPLFVSFNNPFPGYSGGCAQLAMRAAGISVPAEPVGGDGLLSRFKVQRMSCGGKQEFQKQLRLQGGSF